MNADSAMPPMTMCIVCAGQLRDSETQTCSRCVSRVRQQLARIPFDDEQLELADGYATNTRLGQRHTAYDDTALLGGDALSLSAGGTVFGPLVGPRDQSHYADNLPADAPSALATLAGWEDDWRILQGQPAAGVAHLTDVTGYLLANLDWAAAKHHAFDEFARDVHRVATHLMRLTATDPPPERGAACVQIRPNGEPCAGRLEREYLPPCPQTKTECRRRGCHRRKGAHVQGLSDWWTCNRCDTRYDQAKYSLAAHEQIRLSALLRSDRWESVAAAAGWVRRPVKTLREWILAGQLSAACRLRDRRVIVNMGEVYELDQAKQRRDRNRVA